MSLSLVGWLVAVLAVLVVCALERRAQKRNKEEFLGEGKCSSL